MQAHPKPVPLPKMHHHDTTFATRLPISLRRLAAAALALLVSACSTPRPSAPTPSAPAAQDVWVHPYVGGTLELNTVSTDCRLLLTGEINQDALRRLGPVLQAAERASCRNKRLVLSVTQGVVGDAVTLGAMLRNRHYDTEVAAGSSCDTPCLLVFSAGLERVMPASPATTRLAFTQIPPDGDFGQGVCQTELSRGQELTLTRYLRAMLPAHTATAVYQKLLASDCRHTERYSATQAMALGLATGTR